MFDITIIEVPTGNFVDIVYSQPNAGTFAVTSYLTHKGYKVSLQLLQYDLGIPLTQEGRDKFSLNISKIAEELQTRFVGIVCSSCCHYQNAVMVAEGIRNVRRDLPIIVGGTHATVLPQEFCPPFMKTESPFDYIVRGDCESVITSLLANPKRPLSPQIISGISQKNGSVPIEWSLFDKYLDYIFTPSISLARGCPYDCTFCANSGKRDPGWDALLPSQAVELIKNLPRHFTSWNAGDASFGHQADWLYQFLKGYSESGLNEIHRNFVSMMRVEGITPQIAQLMKEAGCSPLIGIESGSPEMLKIMRKTDEPKAFLKSVKRVTRILDELEIPWFSEFILGHPGETKETLAKTEHFINSLIHPQFHGNIICVFPKYFPGSPVSHNLGFYEEKYGAKFNKEETTWWRNFPIKRNECDSYGTGWLLKSSRDLHRDDIITKCHDLNTWLDQYRNGTNPLKDNTVISRYAEGADLFEDWRGLFHHLIY